MRDGGEFIAAANAVLSESCREGRANCGNKGTSTGEKYAVHFARRNTGSRQQRIDAALDGLQFVFDPRFKVAAPDWDTQVHAAVAELEFRALRSRQLELHAL